MQIRDIQLTPVALKDPPLLNARGVHQPFALRCVLEVKTDEGLVGLAETYGGAEFVDGLRRVALDLGGLDPFDVEALRKRIGGSFASDGRAARMLAAFEIACLDLQGKFTGRPVYDLLGGKARHAVPYSAYLFYKWREHPVDPGYPPDEWGEALDPAGIVEQARRMTGRHGFRSLKLKGGVMPPEAEADAILALREAFPDHPLRLDPNTAWTVDTSVKFGRRLDGVLEYLEDPTPGIEGMAQVAPQVAMPLATNMCVVTFAEIPPAVRAGAVKVVLSDVHSWGGFRASQALAAVCETFGLGLSMHSNSHMGISFAAMTHLAAATRNLTYACDTHTPWQTEDVIESGVLNVVDGAVRVPEGPGLGVTLDRDSLARLHEQWQKTPVRERDDAAARRGVEKGWMARLPRF